MMPRREELTEEQRKVIGPLFPELAVVKLGIESARPALTGTTCPALPCSRRRYETCQTVHQLLAPPLNSAWRRKQANCILLIWRPMSLVISNSERSGGYELLQLEPAPWRSKLRTAQSVMPAERTGRKLDSRIRFPVFTGNAGLIWQRHAQRF